MDEQISQKKEREGEKEGGQINEQLDRALCSGSDILCSLPSSATCDLEYFFMTEMRIIRSKNA